MMRECAYISLVPLLACAAFGQSGAPQFESADIHVSPHTATAYMRGGFIRGGRYELRSANMVDLIRTAYSVDADKVLGGPSWLEWDRFDVIAKAPPATSPEMAKTMLQGLLADRFKLQVHKDTKPLPSYALISGKGKPKLKEAEGSGETGCKFTIPPLQASQGAEPPAGGPVPIVPTISYSCHNMTMEAFAAGMRTMIAAQQFVGTNPVLDQTDLKGAWDFNFKYSLPLRLPGAAAAETSTLFDAIDKQLGLKLEPIQVPASVIVVDSVNQKPADNPPGVTESLPALPTEFEVADVRPTAPDVKGIRLQTQPGGRVNIGGMPLKVIIQQAWQVTGDMIVGAPKWLDSDRFDIIAKMPEAYTGPPPAPPVDLDSVWPMLRTLLADRFKLATHMEDQPVPAYTLLAGKPKLKKADPAGRTGCKESAGKDANPAISRPFICQNVTMAQFAEQLQRMSGGYIRNEVLDATGIDGAWDFTLNFSPAALVLGGAGRGGDPGQASDPSGAVSIFEALNKQLGLKLEMQKRTMPVLVIDHIEEKPTDN